METWNREELHAEVWEKPMVKVAAKYGISSVMLGKVCRKLQIPVPGLILFDNNVPRGLARALPAHTVVEARERGWHRFKNGDLLNAAEDEAFDVLVTSDRASNTSRI